MQPCVVVIAFLQGFSSGQSLLKISSNHLESIHIEIHSMAFQNNYRFDPPYQRLDVYVLTSPRQRTSMTCRAASGKLQAIPCMAIPCCEFYRVGDCCESHLVSVGSSHIPRGASGSMTCSAANFRPSGLPRRHPAKYIFQALSKSIFHKPQTKPPRPRTLQHRMLSGPPRSASTPRLRFIVGVSLAPGHRPGRLWPRPTADKESQ